MAVQGMASQFGGRNIYRSLSVSVLLEVSLPALLVWITQKRCWLTPYFQCYMSSLVMTVIGFTVFKVFTSVFENVSLSCVPLCLLIYFICNNISGHSQFSIAFLFFSYVITSFLDDLIIGILEMKEQKE